MTENHKFIAPPLPASIKMQGSIFRADRHGTDTFFVNDNIVLTEGKSFQPGTVFSISRRGIDMLAPYEANETVRRLWCKLSKIPYRELEAAIRKRNEERASRERASEVDFLRKNAKRLGFKVVKA